PLIALMKDQVEALTAAGVPATLLNSSLSSQESWQRMRDLEKGRYKLLYVAPERLLLSGFGADLERWNVARFAIDEAHCISEWGHDFRPEYRRIAELRVRFKDAPFIALTATATERVRADIIERLALRDASVYVASFNRPNLTYRVVHKQEATESLVAWVKKRGDESGIVYVQTRNAAEKLAERLSEAGITSLPYHAGLESRTRNDHQERFLRDDVRVMCATVAFGMGINKSNVRFVVHYDVPKSIEGYYQETGRAGRDGLPAECLLYFSYGDIAKTERFITAIDDPVEQAARRTQLERITRYAYSHDCRRREFLAYFGERWEAPSCDACDNCLEPRPTIDATQAARKFLACVYRIREFSGHDFGIMHVIDILLGAKSEKLMRIGHERLSTYGIGSEFDRRGWRYLADELLRLGLIEQDADRFNIVSLTRSGRRALVEPTPITVREPSLAPATKGARRQASATPKLGGTEGQLFETLRTLRRAIADERDVPAYVVFSDAVLRAMAQQVPRTLVELRAISGVGDRKLEDFGARFLAAITGFSEAE
ncbi:MAG TPA: RecQ family ATP-dependent DNA helicase, partial [Candidatus Baltobacteraceae bacterium]